jgi:aspartokinase
MISTREIKISVVIDLAKGEQAMKAVHTAFIG